jgi:hypothetical protein
MSDQGGEVTARGDDRSDAEGGDREDEHEADPCSIERYLAAMTASGVQVAYADHGAAPTSTPWSGRIRHYVPPAAE